ncbi:MAG: hypothetical protein JXA69_06025 [Phycisphaerae bacterium]|nr:hypothetical protein [Phycisphaerae bacterium]
MKADFEFAITPQPTETTCGLACLHALYQHYGDPVPLDRMLAEVSGLPDGGTLAVLLALHALQRGYRTTIYTCDLVMFDPTWFGPGAPPIQERLRAQVDAKDDPRLRDTTQAYLDYLGRGGQVCMEDITAELMAGILAQHVPIIVGLSATWLYRCMRERPADCEPDDTHGSPTGHFVVVHGVDLRARTARVADPYRHAPNPAGSHSYVVGLDRLISAMMLGIVTSDAKMLLVAPATSGKGEPACRS